MGFKADCYVIRSRRHRTPKGVGARKRGPHEWAQYAITFLHSQGLLPSSITGPELVQPVRLQLGVDPKFLKERATQKWGRVGKELIDEKTVYSAAEVQGIVYRKVPRGRPRKIGS